ncbi:16S rRNA (uracil(1498)-N(3))-methyltransferase [Legionella erythra]|uniref:Ribosomal RNA small subunit methyltransferase E n=1 Tax=Legionella erythra TaxID=448 RepID=A0A0W0TG46_LEGER|nr:16S rRNA (uracil(1498)-N(3))-methyltransferase [Legionella erythra]KTC94593.1 16S rRNA methyltransferase [Legionella erythra]
MREVRIYQPGYYLAGQEITLSEEAGQHVGVVLRMQPGEALTLFSGDNREFKAEITSVHKKRVTVALNSVHAVNRESPLRLHLAQGISKGDKMEWVVQKAVELGVASIQPVLTERCAVKLDGPRLEKKQAQWQAIAVAACEQCGRNQIPLVHPPVSLHDMLEKKNGFPAFILQPGALHRYQTYKDLKMGEAMLLIGPEGGLSPSESADAQQAGFLPLSLGPRILRTETAAIAAISVLQAVFGDL